MSSGTWVAVKIDPKVAPEHRQYDVPPPIKREVNELVENAVRIVLAPYAQRARIWAEFMGQPCGNCSKPHSECQCWEPTPEATP